MSASGTITVAVSGLHRGENPQPGTPVIASLRRMFEDLHCVGLSYDPLESGLYSRGSDRVDTAYLLPFPHRGPELLLERLKQINQKRQIDLIIPCLDSELSNYIAIQAELEHLGIRTTLPSPSSLEMRSKVNLIQFCAENDIEAPLTFWANDPYKLANFADEIGYPVFVKGKFYEAYEAVGRAQVFDKFAKINQTWGTPVLVQQAVLGEEYDVVGLGDGEGNLVSYYPIRKLLRTEKGKGFAGLVVENERITELTKCIVSKLRWNGPFEIEFIKQPGRDFILFEINPRFPAWVDFPAQLGCNLPARLVQSALDLKPTELRLAEAGQFFVRHCTDLVGNMAELAELASDGEFLGFPITIAGERIT